MSRKQFFALFVCHLVPWIIGNGMAVVFPVYARELSADPAVVGYYLSLCYIMLAAGTLSAGWFSDRFQRRKTPIIVTGLVSTPAVWLMGRAPNMWCVAALSSIFYFGVGLTVALASILAGLCAEGNERGKIFGILALAVTLAILIAGSTTGPIADRWGFPTMYAALSLLGIVWAVMGLLLQDKTVAQTRDSGVPNGGRRPGLGGGFYRLLLAGLAVGTAACVAFLGRLLAMDELGFGAAAISGTGAIGAAVTLPLPALVGRLSDRVGRVPLLVAGYLVGTIALLGFAMSTSLWHFWLATALIGLMGCVGSVGSALVADLVPREALGQGLSLFGTSTMVAGIIASAGTGLAFQHLGTVSTFVGGAVLPLLAIGLLIPLRRTAREEPVAAAGLASATA